MFSWFEMHGAVVKNAKPERTAQRTASARRLEFEQLLADLSARFVGITPERVDEEIRRALHEILRFFRIDRCTLLKLLPDRTSWIITHNAEVAGDSSYPVETTLPVALVPWMYHRMGVEREFYAFARLEDLPPKAAVDVQTMASWNIRSGLYIPVAVLKDTEYTFGISSATENRICPPEYIPRLRLLGELLVNALERGMVELSLRQSEARLNLAASAAQAGLWTMDMERGIIWATPKLRELFHFAPDEELNIEHFFSAIHPDDRRRVREHIRQRMERQEALDIEYRILHKGGAIRWISSRGNPSSEGAGPPPYLMGVSIDVTERKRMEAELRERLQEIERLKLQLEKENVYLREEIRAEQGLQKMVGGSEALQYVFFRIQQVASTDATVLILGETGTGKGMVAHAIHEMSARKDRPLITVNCAALPANLIESELFGREKGAFTGAHARQIGRFEVANGGTIFLDEIGEMPLELQTKLLRVLQEGEFERLGSPRTLKVDVRVIVATSRDLKAEIRNKRFREDLFYRLNVFPVTLPPLRMRAEDIPDLVMHFIDRYARKHGRSIKTVPKGTLKTLQGYAWPGNVRELEHVIERAVITSVGPVLQVADRLEGEVAETREETPQDLASMEREYIMSVLQKTRWKIDGDSGAAALLGLHPSTLRFRLKKLCIKRS